MAKPMRSDKYYALLCTNVYINIYKRFPAVVVYGQFYTHKTVSHKIRSSFLW